MSKQLYEEALADVKKLKEIAEDNAKKALIEAVSPRIKDLIEAELLKEVSDEDDENDLLTDDGIEDSIEIKSAIDIDPTVSSIEDPAVVAAMSMPDEEGKVTLDLDALQVEPVGPEFELSNESLRLLNPISEKINSATALKVESKLFQLSEATQKFLAASVSIKKTASYQRKILEMVSEIENVYEFLQDSAGNLQDKGVYEGKLEQLYKQLNKLVEQYNMKKNLKSLLEADLTLKLTNVPDDLPLEDLGVDIVADEEGDDEEEEGEDEGGELDLDSDEESSESGEEGESDEGGDEPDLGGDEEEKAEEAQKMEYKRLSNNTIVEIDENMLRREIARMRSLREAADDVQSWGHGPGDVSSEEDFESDDLGDPFLDVELSETQNLKTEDGDEGWWKLGIDSGFVTADEAEKMKGMIEVDDKQEEDVKEVDEMSMEMDELDELDEMSMEMDELDQAGDDESAVGPGGASNASERRTRTPGAKQNEQQKKQQGQQKQKKQGMHQYGEVDQQDEGQDMDEADQQDEADQKDESQQVKEARRRLAREASLQTEAKKKAQAAKKQQKEAQQKAKKKQQEAQQKMKQKKQQEAQKAKQEAQKQAKQAKKMQEAYAYYANIFNESVRRTAKLQSVLAESRNEARRNGASTRSTEETSTLRKKLAETNLFNTKLLYCNKLLQNESLTKRQKAEVIERLDEAKSEREVKLVYESLVKTIGRPTRALSEGIQRVLGSSSQATRPASTVLSEGYEADRWAKLAGLK